MTVAEINALGRDMRRLQNYLAWERASVDLSCNTVFRDLSAEQAELDRLETLYWQQRKSYEAQQAPHRRLGRAIKKGLCCGA